MSKSIILILLSLASLAFAHPTPPQLNTYQYWVRVPQTHLSCQDEATLLAGRFTSATGLAVTEALCRGTVDAPYDNSNKVSLYSLLLTYQAAQEPNLYTALYGFMDFQRIPTTSNGAYAKYSDCLAAIGEQSSNYERETGLKAIAAHCQPANLEGSFLLRVEGFGKPARQLFVLHSLFTGNVPEYINQAADRLITSLNAHLVLRVDTHSFYYRETSLDLRQNNFGTFSKPAECAEQVEAAVNLYTKGGSKQRIVACLEHGDRMVLNGLADGNMLFSFFDTPVYYSFDECMQDRERSIRANTSFSRPFGAICVEDYWHTGQYRIRLYQ